MSTQSFIATVAPIASQLRQEGSILIASVRIAQAMLETGCQLHPWNNLIGFKVGSGQPNAFWKGQSVSTKTWEVYNGIRYDQVQANWRVYACIEDGFRDQELLFLLKRYDRVRAANSPQEQTNALYLCGYATDPAYASKLNKLIAQYELHQYDKEVLPLLNPDVANTIISTWMKEDWNKASQQEAVAKGKGNEVSAQVYKQQADYIHWLANELRKASGQPQQ
ncbi:Exo-glucosaminidase LytG precursor [compost metagenome]